MYGIALPISRPLRIQYPDAWYHIMNRGGKYKAVFEDKNDYSMFLDLLQETVEIFHIKVSSFCLMQNNYHLLIQTPEANISRTIRHIEVPESRLLALGKDKMISVVCTGYKVPSSDLLVSKRGQVNEPRNVAIYLMRQH